MANFNSNQHNKYNNNQTLKKHSKLEEKKMSKLTVIRKRITHAIEKKALSQLRICRPQLYAELTFTIKGIQIILITYPLQHSTSSLPNSLQRVPLLKTSLPCSCWSRCMSISLSPLNLRALPPNFLTVLLVIRNRMTTSFGLF